MNYLVAISEKRLSAKVRKFLKENEIPIFIKDRGVYAKVVDFLSQSETLLKFIRLQHEVNPKNKEENAEFIAEFVDQATEEVIKIPFHLDYLEENMLGTFLNAIEREANKQGVQSTNHAHYTNLQKNLAKLLEESRLFVMEGLSSPVVIARKTIQEIPEEIPQRTERIQAEPVPREIPTSRFIEQPSIPSSTPILPKEKPIKTKEKAPKQPKKTFQLNLPMHKIQHFGQKSLILVVCLMLLFGLGFGLKSCWAIYMKKPDFEQLLREQKYDEAVSYYPDKKQSIENEIFNGVANGDSEAIEFLKQFQEKHSTLEGELDVYFIQKKWKSMTDLFEEHKTDLAKQPNRITFVGYAYLKQNRVDNAEELVRLYGSNAELENYIQKYRLMNQQIEEKENQLRELQRQAKPDVATQEKLIDEIYQLKIERNQL